MTGPGPADHRAALAAMRAIARDTAIGIAPAELPEVLDTHAAAAASAVTGSDAEQVAGLARAYVFGARVGGQAADPERAARWLAGWSRARARTPDEVHLAVLDGVRFGERLHRALGIDGPGDPGGSVR